MKTPDIRMCLTAVLLIFTAGCKKGSDPTPAAPTTKSITTQAEAKSIYNTLKSLVDRFETQLPSGSSTTTKNGGEGTAKITGKKTSDKSSSSSSSYSTSTSDITVSFSDFSSGDVLVTGTVSSHDYIYTRTACSSSSCATATDVNEYVRGSSIDVEFTYNGAKIKETIEIDVSRTSNYGTLSGKLKTKTGNLYSI